MRHIMLAVLLVGILPAAPGQAATIVDTLLQSSNSTDPTAMAGQWVAQKFIPQVPATLDSVTLRMGRLPPYIDQVDPVVELWAGSQSAPTSLVGGLTFPGTAMPMFSLMSVTFDGNHLPLTANMAYWIVLKSPASTYAWRSLNPANVAACNALTCGPAFAPENLVTVDGGLTWLNNFGLTAKMKVDASPVPEPATAWVFAPLGALPLFLAYRRSRMRA